jgi:uncharacterized membrane protein (UPF0127 family)
MVADEAEERRVGLMFREDLGANEGMLFVFPESAWRGFWMRDTPSELDIIFLNEGRQVMNIERGVPFSERSVRSAGRAKYVIEIPQGRSVEVGLRRRDIVALPEVEAVD